MSNKEVYDPIPEILEQFFWALSCLRKYRGSPEEMKFRQLAQHLGEELLKYLIK